METNYNKQASDFLTKYNISFSSQWSRRKKTNYSLLPSDYVNADKGIDCPLWCDGKKHTHGEKYTITLRKEGKLVQFDFFSSWQDESDFRKIQGNENKEMKLRPYGVLACISGDIYIPETFEDFCSEFGYDTDSIKAEKTFKESKILSNKLRNFFTEEEISELQEIR